MTDLMNSAAAAGEWMPLWLAIVGIFGGIATQIVTHFLNKRSLRAQTTEIQTGQSEIKQISNGRLTEALQQKEDLAVQVAALQAELGRVAGERRADAP